MAMIFESNDNKKISKYVEETLSGIKPENKIQCYACRMRKAEKPEIDAEYFISKCIEYFCTGERVSHHQSSRWLVELMKIGLSRRDQSLIFELVLKNKLTPQELIISLLRKTHSIDEITQLKLIKYACFAKKAHILEIIFLNNVSHENLVSIYYQNEDVKLNCDEINYLIDFFISSFNNTKKIFLRKFSETFCVHFQNLSTFDPNRIIFYLQWASFIVTVGYFPIQSDSVNLDQLKKLQKIIGRLKNSYTEMSKIENVLSFFEESNSKQSNSKEKGLYYIKRIVLD